MEGRKRSLLVSLSLWQDPPNLSEMMKPVQNASSPASLGLKDEDDDDAEGEDGDGDGEKVDPVNVNPERLKAFNVRTVFFCVLLSVPPDAKISVKTHY